MTTNQSDMLPGGGFTMLDHFGTPVTEASFFGRHLLVFFGFTHCKVVCPENLAKLSKALDALGDQAQALYPLYITVDPARDTPERMRTFLEERYPRFLGLTGGKAEVDAMKHAFRVYAEREVADGEGGYDVPHTAITYIMGPDGGYVAHLVDALTADEVEARLRTILFDSSMA